jgi:hypothetical protein
MRQIEQENIIMKADYKHTFLKPSGRGLDLFGSGRMMPGFR